jgi:archaellum component FlaC
LTISEWQKENVNSQYSYILLARELGDCKENDRLRELGINIRNGPKALQAEKDKYLSGESEEPHVNTRQNSRTKEPKYDSENIQAEYQRQLGIHLERINALEDELKVVKDRFTTMSLMFAKQGGEVEELKSKVSDLEIKNQALEDKSQKLEAKNQELEYLVLSLTENIRKQDERYDMERKERQLMLQRIEALTNRK